MMCVVVVVVVVAAAAAAAATVVVVVYEHRRYIGGLVQVEVLNIIRNIFLSLKLLFCTCYPHCCVTLAYSYTVNVTHYHCATLTHSFTVTLILTRCYH